MAIGKGPFSLGCCCQGNDEPPPLCQSDYESDFSDDFSPSFDLDWTVVPNLIASGGVVQVNGEWDIGNPGTSSGYAQRLTQKQTEAGDITATIKLVDWHNVLTPSTVYQAFLRFYSPYSYWQWFGVEAYNANSFGINKYRFTRGIEGTVPNAQTVLAATPQDGDTFGIRFKSFVPLPPYTAVQQATSVEVLVNGIVIHTFTGPDLPSFDQCSIRLQIGISQPAFPGGILVPGRTIVKLDDFDLLCE